MIYEPYTQHKMQSLVDKLSVTYLRGLDEKPKSLSKENSTQYLLKDAQNNGYEMEDREEAERYRLQLMYA